MWGALPQYILMGLILGFVAVKDDGMELSLGLHMANNIIAAITITSDSSTLQTHASDSFAFRHADDACRRCDLHLDLQPEISLLGKDLFMEKDPKGKQRNVKCYFFLKTSAFPC